MATGISLNFHGLWGQSASRGPMTGPLDRDMTVDVAVVGGGYTGLSTALHLAELGQERVVVLEARDIGFGASGRNAGLVNAGAWLQPDALPERLGPEYGGRLLDTLGNGPDLVFDIIQRYGIDCNAVRNGTLHCAAGQAGLADITERAKQWQARGVAVQLLNQKETERLVGTSAYCGSLLDPRAGTIQPLSYARGLAKAVIELGASIYTSTAVSAADSDSKGWRLSTSTGFTVRARRVVVATNTAQEVRPDAWPQLQTGLVRLPYFNVATVPLPPEMSSRILPERQGAWDTRSVLSSFHVDAAGRLVYGSVGSVGQNPGDVHVQWVRRSIKKLFPDLRNIPIEYQWYGWIDITDNNLPSLHECAPDVWAVCGYNGRGIGPGTILGRALAQMLAGKCTQESMPLRVTGIHPVSYKHLRELFYAQGSKVAHLLSNRF